SELLAVDGIGVHDNFFVLGGNSLKIIKLYDCISRKLNDAIKVSDLFDNPTIRRQARILSDRQGLRREHEARVDVLEF
ncbi:MAG: hypothetical protein ICV83_08575, partial [Cytophagales bacterium]|nr:hypothetical protein [Cytophagales bacterium]